MSQWPEITTEQIVARLRMIVAEPEKWCETDRHFVEDAADEIERLRDERAARIDELVRNTDEFRETLTVLRRDVKTLTAERDEARREVLLWVKERCSWAELSDEIEKRGWDYLKEER